jgi:monofunctional biosynthetic peptidoglycan transglycosylase
MNVRWRAIGAGAARLLALVAVGGLALQLYFALRVALMIVVDPTSTSFQRSEIWRLVTERRTLAWSQQWVPYDRLAEPLKRAVIASEDAGFAEHSGVEWDAIERAWERNQREAERAERRAGRPGQPPRLRPARVVGGSTITQQLAKNLFLGPERRLARKAQELVIAWMLEALLDKPRILEIYLNNVEWGEGVFGAEAAARRYFGTSADRLGALASARLAVLLPAPKRFERRPDSPYLLGRASAVVLRMGDVVLP